MCVILLGIITIDRLQQMGATKHKFNELARALFLEKRFWNGSSSRETLPHQIVVFQFHQAAFPR